MSMQCEEVRPLLAELVYDEVDPGLADQLREHLGTCLSCRRHQMAYLAVRKDLNEWQPAEETSPSGITFIAPGAHTRTPIWGSRLFQGLAIAASFVFGAFLMAAAVNLQVQSGPEGWAMSTSFSDQTLDMSAPPEKPGLVAVDQIHKLDSYIGEYLTTSGVAFADDLPSHEELTLAQRQWVNRQSAQITADLVAQVIAERDAEHEGFLRQLVVSSLDDHSDEFQLMFSNVVRDLEERRTDDFLTLATDIVDTRRKVNEANNRIDNLDNLVTQATAQPERHNPEQ